jgi:hypothetical protein
MVRNARARFAARARRSTTERDLGLSLPPSVAPTRRDLSRSAESTGALVFERHPHRFEDRHLRLVEPPTGIARTRRRKPVAASPVSYRTRVASSRRALICLNAAQHPPRRGAFDSHVCSCRPCGGRSRGRTAASLAIRPLPLNPTHRGAHQTRAECAHPFPGPQERAPQAHLHLSERERYCKFCASSTKLLIVAARANSRNPAAQDFDRRASRSGLARFAPPFGSLQRAP